MASPVAAMDSEIEMGGNEKQQLLVEQKTLKFADIRYQVLVTQETVNEDGGEEGEEKPAQLKVGDKKDILRGVSGTVRGGNMLCILGPSGSGKTSLLHIISGRIKTTASGSHNVQGTVSVDNEQLDDTSFRRISGMVTQEDIFTDCLTVEETLMFSAALKLRDLTVAERTARVNEVIGSLQLDQCRSTYIGDDANPYLKGISGGEKRRLAIASEILDPSINILMLDEPTSGLDAAAAQNVANLLRRLSDSGMAVLATLHQPRSTIMERFDGLMVLAKGRCIFNGTLPEYTPYLVNDLKCKLPEHESPYELLLDALNPAIAEACNVKIGLLEDKEVSDVGEELANQFDKHSASMVDKEVESDKGATVLAAEPKSIGTVIYDWCYTTWVILHRTFLIKMRDPICLATQISSAIIMGIIFGALYYDVYDKSTESFAVLDAQMCIVMSTLMAVWLPYDVLLTFPKERKIFLRERKGGLYTSSAFYMARITADVPAHVVSAIIMALVVWGMAGLMIDPGLFTLIMIYSIIVGAAVMQLIGAISRTFEEANIYMMVVLMMSMMLGTGFVREVPSFLTWAREISIMGICADLAMYLEFKDVVSKYGTAAEIFDQYGVLITDEATFNQGILTLFYILLFCRVFCYLAVKFVFTGRTFSEDMAD